jgi:hypothetical protein
MFLSLNDVNFRLLLRSDDQTLRTGLDDLVWFGLVFILIRVTLSAIVKNNHLSRTPPIRRIDGGSRRT